jgi:heterodisulfide reductase subunit A-like polyferredoxin
MATTTRRIYAVTRGCTFCNTCVFECRHQAITMTNRGAVIDPARCRGCARCYDNCASEAITPVEPGPHPRSLSTRAGEG